ncbi:FecR family protein [Flavivirga spongiicola]|uniref:FecR family protein n=1 Tax=Flavivirga spongiicola TaxID=421621 RepID=A0ABU7XLU3_9FLAO|nr:FecR family protein [Flavivirga sp. MEBiC05379]MDO5981391.1 FecR family protein [Flavivirga sp. MEBiC05379]
MKYIHYSVEDFVKDEYFQKWILDTDTMTSNFWNNWIVKYPEMKDTVEEAKKLILLIDFEKDQLSGSDFDTMWQYIIEKRNTKLATSHIISKRKVKTLYWKYAAAASVLLVVALTIFLNRENNLPQVTEPIIVKSQIEVGSNKATLTLADGSNIDLDKDKVYKSDNVTTNGEEIVYNKDSSEEIAYNYLTIPRGGQFSIKLSDGTKVWLNSESQLKYPVSFTKGKTRQVELIYGEAYFDVSPSSENHGADFKVYNNKQEVQVLGTEFNIKAYKNETNIYTTLVEGSVAINYEDIKQNLIPNQQSILSLNNNELSIKTVDVYNEISWKEGVFVFEDKSLKDIMKVLSRWYDMEVIFKNKEVEDEEFFGILEKNQKIEEILVSIKNFGIIQDYEIKNKEVVLE